MTAADNGKVSVVFGGQGAQKPAMFNDLLCSKNLHVRRAGEEVLQVLREELHTDGTDLIDVYTKEDTHPDKINSTRNVQPGLAAYFAALYTSLKNQIGHDIIEVGTGYSFGIIPALYALDVLSLGDMLNLAMMRGEAMSSIKPGQFYVMTIKTKDTVHANRMNWTALRGTGYRVCIRLEPDFVSLSGPITSKDEAEENLMESGLLERRIIRPDSRVYHAPFHNKNFMSHPGMVYEDNVRMYDERMTKGTGESVFKDLKDGLAFVTNGGKVLTGGADIRKYIGRPHIAQIVYFDKTVNNVGKLNPDVIAIATPSLKRYAGRGYIHELVPIGSGADIEEAARRYNSIMKRRARAVEQPVQGGLQPSYQT